MRMVSILCSLAALLVSTAEIVTAQRQKHLEIVAIDTEGGQLRGDESAERIQ